MLMSYLEVLEEEGGVTPGVTSYGVLTNYLQSDREQ